MENAIGKLAGSVLAVFLMGHMAVAGGPCQGCRDTATGVSYAGTGCGPRVYGPVREPVGPIDQCDACARFQGCEGYRQLPEMLAPWQLPPGRGFRPPEACGYVPEPCAECAGCGPGGWWRRFW